MDEVFEALAHPDRRVVLDRLRGRGGQTLGELTAGLAMSRQAASKHLAVLESAGLLVVRWQGREKLHFLNPVPLQEVAARWLREFDAPRAAALTALSRALHQSEEGSMEPKGFVYQVVVAASAEAVWEALTTGEFSRQYWFGRTVASEWRVGSPVTVTTPEGVVEVTGEVRVSDRPRRLSYSWNTANGDTDGTVVTFELQALGPLVKLTVLHDLDMTSAAAPQAAQGWTFILNGLKTFLETGRPLPSIPWKR